MRGSRKVIDRCVMSEVKREIMRIYRQMATQYRMNYYTTKAIQIKGLLYMITYITKIQKKN